MEKIEKELKAIKDEIFSLLDQLDEQQQKEFTWRCCVRSLAFLSDNVSVRFWEELFPETIFDVLDLMSYGGKHVEEVIIKKVSENHKGTEEEKAKEIAKKLSSAFEDPADIEYFHEQMKSTLDDSMMEIPEYFERKYPQSDDYFDSDDYYDLSGSISDAVIVSEAIWNGSLFFDKQKVSLQKVVEKNLAVTNNLTNATDFSKAILNDLKATIAHQKPTFSVNLYQKTMGNFDSAMRKMKLRDKANLYKGIWNNDFDMNIEDLKKRISYFI